MAEDLLDTIGQLFGPIRGGLAYAVIFVGALLAATTGVVAASVISMGLISLPIMLRYGYDRRLASGVIAASGTLAQIIPPSLVLIVMADQLGRSVGDMYEGAFIPGFVLTGLYVALRPADDDRSARMRRRRCRPRRGRSREADGSSGMRLAAGRWSSSPSAAVALSATAGPMRADRRASGRRDVVGVGVAFVVRGRQPASQARPAVAAGRAGDLRADPAAGADLPGARHDLPRHRHADRGRRDGRGRRAGHGAGASAG